MSMRKEPNQAHVAGSLQECLTTMGGLNFGSERLCKATWDGILCWPPTLPGMTIRQQCPDIKGYSPSGYAYKTCDKSATWFTIPGVDARKGWTNYSDCEIRTTTMSTTTTATTIRATTTTTAAERTTASFVVTRGYPIHDGYVRGKYVDVVGAVVDDDHDYDYSSNAVKNVTRDGNDDDDVAAIGSLDVVGIVCNSLSLVSLLLAIFLFGCLVRNLATQRHKILVPLFATSLLRFVAKLSEVVVPLVGDTNSSASASAALCVLVSYVAHFSSLSSYAWIVVLGIYYLFAALDDVIKRSGMLVLYVVGFGIPVVFTTAWVLTVTGALPGEFASCRFDFVRHESRWIFDAPKIACILMAVCLLTVCVYALCRSRPGNVVTPEMTFASQGTVKTLVFLLLSSAADLYLLVDEYGEYDRKTATGTAYLNVVLRGAMGVVMATFLSFTDSEVWRGRSLNSGNQMEVRQNGGKHRA